MDHLLLRNQKEFLRDIQLGIGYSFIRDFHVSYTLVYDDTYVFSYKKTPLQGSQYIQEEYIGSDSPAGMLALIDSIEVSRSRILYHIITRSRIGIVEKNIIEIHYSYSMLEKDFTLYIYSASIEYLQSLCEISFDIPSLDAIKRDMSMYCLKLKIKEGLQEYTPSIVFTSNNVDDGRAYSSLQDSQFFGGGFGDIALPPIIDIHNPLYTYEVAYNLVSRRIENFTLFYILRHKTHAESTPL